MSTEYIGSVTLYLDAAEVEITKIDVKDSTGVGQYDITATAVMPTDGTAINWGSIEDAKISLVPDVPGAKPTSYLGFCVTEVGESYTVDNEMVIDITGFAIRKVLE